MCIRDSYFVPFGRTTNGVACALTEKCVQLLAKAQVLGASDDEQRRLLWTSYGVGSVPPSQGDFVCFLLVIPNGLKALREGAIIDTRKSFTPKANGVMKKLLAALGSRSQLPIVELPQPVLQPGAGENVATISARVGPGCATTTTPSRCLLVSIDLSLIHISEPTRPY